MSTPTASIISTPEYLCPAELQRLLALPDLSRTAPSARPHAIAMIADDIIGALTAAWQIPANPVRVPPMVAVADNYDRLGYRSDDVTRDNRYTRYLSPTTMLRSHTSANIPYALSGYATVRHDRPVDELINVAGLVYRRDVVDRHHVGEPHQLDLWRLRSAPGTSEDQLQELIGLVVDTVLPGARWRTTPAIHPYTESGQQVDVLTGGRWLELAECGLIGPHVLRNSGLDPDAWSGLALGLGLDRAVMLRKQIPDIRYLRSTEPRIAAQLGDLQPWRPVSMLPSITRDLSVVIDVGAVEESIGDAIRTALGGAVGDVESIELRSRTPYAELPSAARERLGITAGQENALIRLTLRPLEHTLTDEQANAIRNQVYRAIHRGPYAELA